MRWPAVPAGDLITEHRCQADSNQRVGIIEEEHQAEYRFLEEAQVSTQSIASLSIQLQDADNIWKG